MSYPREKIMFYGRDRVFYHGLIGRVDCKRLNGAFTIYAAQSGTLLSSINGGPKQSSPIIVVPPHTEHIVQSANDRVSVILIEPETVCDADLEKLRALVNNAESGARLWRQISDARENLQVKGVPDDMAPAEFDQAVLGLVLAPRQMDPRVTKALRLFATCDPGEGMTAEDFARAVRLSASRFLRLFKEETGLRFRSYRMWRRARAFLPHVTNAGNLAHLALELGYPDSTHFSHSIRRVYGLKPRSILEGSRQLQVIASPIVNPEFQLGYASTVPHRYA